MASPSHMQMIKQITITPAAASFVTQYSSGDVIGLVNTVANAAANKGGGFYLTGVVVTDLANQKSALDLIFFNTAPVNSIGADNAAYGLVDADVTYLIGRYNVAAASYISSGSNNAEFTVGNLWIPMQAIAGNTSIYMAVISRGTPTYGSAADLVIKLGIQQF